MRLVALLTGEITVPARSLTLHVEQTRAETAAFLHHEATQEVVATQTPQNRGQMVW